MIVLYALYLANLVAQDVPYALPQCAIPVHMSAVHARLPSTGFSPLLSLLRLMHDPWLEPLSLSVRG